MTAKVPIVDAHVHVGHGRRKRLQVEDLLAKMDRHGVGRAVICPVDEEIIHHNREGNDRILAAVRANPFRLVGFAVANPWHGQAAVKELRRAAGQGLRGLKLHSSLQGFRLTETWIDPLVGTAVDLGLPVYCHTGTANWAMPFQLAELAHRFPQGAFIMGHGGASDYWYDVAPAMERADNLYLELSKVPPSGLAAILAAHPEWADRILFGSNLPGAAYAAELTKVPSVVTDPGIREAIMGGNMERLLQEAGA